MRGVHVQPPQLPGDCAEVRSEARSLQRKQLDAGRFVPSPNARLTGSDTDFSALTVWRSPGPTQAEVATELDRRAFAAPELRPFITATNWQQSESS